MNEKVFQKKLQDFPSDSQEFKDTNFSEINYLNHRNGNLIKANEIKFLGNVKLEINEDKNDGVKIILKKDSNDNIKEIKFICSCGETKSLLFDYPEE
ncbi:MAG: hypothetical protein STSR0008_00580 [Ignavibacterium sp.]